MWTYPPFKSFQILHKAVHIISNPWGVMLHGECRVYINFSKHDHFLLHQWPFNFIKHPLGNDKNLFVCRRKQFGSNLGAKMKFWVLLLCGSHFPQVGRFSLKWVAFLLQEAFGGLPGVQIRRLIARWKDIGVYFPTQVELFNLNSIYPVKNQISQDWSKCTKWGCLKAECCWNQLLKVFLNSKLISW